MRDHVVIKSHINPYRDNVQGKANEPITVAGLLDRARRILGMDVQCTLDEVYDRLEENAPRIAVIGGSLDHPAHITDWETVLRAAARIWQKGGVPFHFSIPVVCDGTAQSNIGMCYSLQSRNAVTAMVVSQMEGQSYHGAFVIQGCDKTPLAIVSALALLDRVRRARGEAPVFATFAPAHVLKGGTIPPDLRQDLEAVARRAEAVGHPAIAHDLRDAAAHILQCSSNQAFQGVLSRAVQEGIISQAEHKALEKRLAVNTCDALGGICAFHGTGNSSRDVVSALGLVHPAVEFLTEPPTQEQINRAVDALFGFCNDPRFSVSAMVAENIENAVRVHSALGGSTNLMMHIVAAVIHAGYAFDIWQMDAIRRQTPVPDIFDYSLTQGRDVFVLAQQYQAGRIRGIETVIYELVKHGVPMNLDAPTVTGTTWRERLSDTRNLSADGVTDNPIILSRPRRPVSGVDVLSGNFLESAVVKISGMADWQLDEFDEKVAIVLYYENEDEVNRALLNTRLLEQLGSDPALPSSLLLALHRHNARLCGASPSPNDLPSTDLIRLMARQQTLLLAVVISGQGPEAYGMPEMFTPTQHINANRELQRLAVLISDGRYSGVTYGAAIGHVTPEAARKGGILYLQTGDLIQVRLRARELLLLDRKAFIADGTVRPYAGALAQERARLGEERLARIWRRRTQIAPTNQLRDVTDAAHGVVPLAVAEMAQDRLRPRASLPPL